MTNKSLDPVGVSRKLIEGYLQYLKTTFPLRSEDLRQQFWALLEEQGRLAKGPLLESTQPFVTGLSLTDLISSGVLHPDLAHLPADAFPVDRPLYWHQEVGIRKVVQQQRNILVATGTGSGKTETFLVPIIDHLLKENDAGSLALPGVRALLLYPMNALANDQLKRLRTLLAPFPQITVGRYIGDTPDERREAEEKFEYQFPGQRRIPNELLSREAMQSSPPHILLTNYAMLEYLLLRPKDAPFFDGATARHWRFIVLDEAHSYDGAAGTETAFLLRRLRDRLVRSQTGKLRCIATSATIGADYAGQERVCEFATSLLGEKFEWVPEDPSRQDLVAGKRQPLDVDLPCWGKGDRSLYLAALDVASRRYTTLDEVEAALRSALVPPQFATPWSAAAECACRGIADPHVAIQRFCYHLLRGDRRLGDLRGQLESPRPLADVSLEAASDQEDPVGTLAALVSLAAAARDSEGSEPLLSARYHLFFRSLEGAFICTADHPNLGGRLLRLTRHRTCPSCESRGRRRRMYEIATCDSCGAEYLVGQLSQAGDCFTLEQASQTDFDSSERQYFLLSGDTQANEDDEVAAQLEDDLEGATAYSLCPECGRVEPGIVQIACGCGTSAVPLQHIPTNPSQPLLRCVVCGVRSSRKSRPPVAAFLTGSDAPVSVLTQQLYQAMPESPDDRYAGLPGEGRKLLVFADSRQDAAFFAHYVERTYAQMLRRRLIKLALADSVRGEDLRLQDLVSPVERLLRKIHLVPETMSRRQASAEAWRIIMQEFLSLARRQSLEGVGLMGIRLVPPSAWVAPRALLGHWGLTAEESWLLVEVLVNTLRTQGGVTFPEGIQPEDEAFAPRNRPLYVRELGSDPSKGILSWFPTRGNNSRQDYLHRLAAKLKLGQSDSQIKDTVRLTLKGIWSIITSLQWEQHLVKTMLPRGGGIVHQVSHQVWEVFNPVSSEGETYRCTACGRMTVVNLRSVCPSYRCPGELRPVGYVAGSSADEDHYRKIYTSMLPIALVAEEHTAQWRTEEAARIQQSFIKGEVNLLSCSTTFELGVDVGDLQAVLLRNVPPTAANYIQRAGRAGRRTDATALVVTYAQRRSHDLTFFSKPERMVAGVVSPPSVVLQNEKIAKRHVHSVALAAFFREEYNGGGGRLYRSVGPFFDGSESGAHRFLAFLRRRPPELRAAIKRFLPETLQAVLGVDQWQWAEELCDDVHSPLSLALAEVTGDLKNFRELADEAYAQQRGREGDRYRYVVETIRGREILGFLASRNVLPKYGFPVDLVELKTEHINSESAPKLDLTRDLRIAIAEYAPGSEVVAGKRIWTGGGLYLPHGRHWVAYHYHVCSECGRFRKSQRAISDVCPGCGAAPRSSKLAGQFLIPEFGFVAAPEGGSEPGEARPRRGYSSRVFFSEYGNSEEDAQPFNDLQYHRLGVQVRYARQGKLVVVNNGPHARGFLLCETCGYGSVAGEKRSSNGHLNPRTTKRCGGSLVHRHLGHEFHTDVVEVRFAGYRSGSPIAYPLWLSLVYALVEGASSALQIKRGDIDGCLYPYAYGVPPAVIVFDTVPGGAGHAQRIARELPLVLDAACERVSLCECGPETSCYECLRSYTNQPYHELLRRGDVAAFLGE